MGSRWRGLDTLRQAGKPSIKAEITAELCTAIEALGAPYELMEIVGSWGDTLGDKDTLFHIRNYNAKGTMFEKVVCQPDDASPNNSSEAGGCGANR